MARQAPSDQDLHEYLMQSYSRWLQTYPDHHIERVPFEKIRFRIGWLGYEEGIIPKPHPGNPELGYEPPRLIKHNDGFYTILDGRRRLYDQFLDEQRTFWIKNMRVYCLVKNEIDPKPSFGKFIWQVGTEYKEVKTRMPKRIWRWLSGHTRFKVIYGASRKSLSIPAQRLLGEVEDAIGTLYSDGLTRLFDLQLIARIEECPREQQQKVLESQKDILKKYEAQLVRLAANDISVGKRADGLLQQLSQAIAKDLARSRIAAHVEQELAQLKQMIDMMIVTYQAQLDIMATGAIPDHAQAMELIQAEKKFLETITHWTHRKNFFDAPY